MNRRCFIAVPTSVASAFLMVLTMFSGCRPQPQKTDAEPVETVQQSQPHRSEVTSQGSHTTGSIGDPGIRLRQWDVPGFRFERYDDMHGLRRIFEVNGGGVGVIDYDLDGWLECVMTNGCHLPVAATDQATPSALFRNLQGQAFANTSQFAGLLQYGYAYGCAVGDYNSDGFDDIYITTLHENSLWENNGDGTFQNVTAFAAVPAPVFSSSAAFADINNDGWLDLYVVNYLDDTDESPRLCPNRFSPSGYEGCSPAVYEGLDDCLYLSRGDGTFEDATPSCGLAGKLGKGLGVLIQDLNHDRQPEIYIANDGQANFLFQIRYNAKQLTMTDTALTSGVALSEAGYAQAGMGIAVGDYDANGEFDLYLTHFYNDTNTLYANRGNLNFQEMTRHSGVGPLSRKVLGFGTLMVDFDYDGWLDLFVANGHVDDRTWMLNPEPFHMLPQVLHNTGQQQFREVSNYAGEYFQKTWLGRGVAAADLDRDGKEDLIVNQQQDQSVILKNDSVPSPHTVTLEFVGRGSNRSAIGVVATVVGSSPQLMRGIAGGSSFQSATAPEIILPAEAPVDIEIAWPSGTTQHCPQLSAGRWLIIEDLPPYPLPR